LFGTIKRADLSAIKIKTAELSLIAIAPLNLFYPSEAKGGGEAFCDLVDFQEKIDGVNRCAKA
jgi:hypothetical protein